MTVFFIVGSLLFLLLTLLCWLFLFWYKRRYTREKFAFSLLLHYTSIITLFLQYVLAPNYFATAVNYVLTEFLHQQEMQFEQPGIVEIVAVIIILIAYFRFTSKIHRNWKGGKSVEEIENNFGNREMYILHESLQFITNRNARILSQEKKT